ncbi:MAG: hypothetical protein R3Y09_10360 [Clostridia bacterium]
MKDLLTGILDPENVTTYSSKFNRYVANIYKIQNNCLVRQKTFSKFENSILGINDDDFCAEKDVKKIISDIFYEYKKFNFNGIFLDFHGEEHSEFVYLLDERCYKEHIELYVPQKYAKVVDNAKIVISTAISGGNLQQIFEYSILQYGLNRICAEISLDAYEFDIPSYNDLSRKIVRPTKTDLTSVFFSENLCTNYYTKMTDSEHCVFTIFDDENSFKKKLEIIHKLTVKDIFINCKFIEMYDFLQ